MSKGAAVYKGVSEKEIFKLFQDLSGASKMPNPVDRFDKHGNKRGITYTIEDSSGNVFNLRNFSNSSDKTNAKWTIDINVENTPSNKRSFNKTFELKFQ